MERTEKLKKELESEVRKESPDMGAILRLSSDLAKTDPNQIRFSVDADVINRLGRELVARQETALSELAKNAYDADATSVEMLFWRTEGSGGSLTITDDGVGMTRQQLVDGFMRLSSQDKVDHPFSPKYHRRRAGRKGIGRFAAQRLGSRLEVITQTAGSENALSVEIQWDKFVGNVDLFSVAVPIAEKPKERLHGTTLRIEGLRDRWSDASIQRVYRRLLELLQPFPLGAPSQSTQGDPGFRVEMSKGIGVIKSPIANLEQEVYKHALATIKASVDSQGSATWSVASSNLDVEEAGQAILGMDGKPIKFAYLCDVNLIAYYFIWDTSYLSGQRLTAIRELAAEQGGIRLYRNGFRVLPYGESEDDWLGLDAAYTSRSFLPPATNKNFFGFLEVKDPEGALFEETASREGLLHGEAFKELTGFGLYVLHEAVKRIASARGRKVSAGQKNWIREPRQPDSPDDPLARSLTELTKSIEKLGSDGSSGAPDAVGKVKDDLLAKTKDLVAAVGEERRTSAELLEELSMLRVLGSLGLTISEFTHEVKHLFAGLNADMIAVEVALMGDEEHRAYASRLRENFEFLRSFTAFFDRAVSDNARRELAVQDVASVARQFAATIRDSASKYGIALKEPVVRGFDVFSCPMHRSEWQSILLNFFTNSRKAIGRTGHAGRIGMQIGKDDDLVYLEFYDDGDGIPEKHRSRIFDAFFTTTATLAVADELSSATGAGLGLKIVQDIAQSYGGSAMVVDPPEGFVTGLRFEVRAATDEEIASSGL